MGDHCRERAVVLRIGVIEARGDEIGVLLVLGEDDGLAEAVAARHTVATRHQDFQRLIDGVGVEQPLVDRLRRHLIGILVLVEFVAPVLSLPTLLLLLGQVVVLDSLPREREWNRHRARRDEILVPDGLVEAVIIGGNAGFEVEQAVGVVVDLILRGSGESQQERIEVLEDAAILLIHRPVGLIDDDQVEVARTESSAAVVEVVDQTHHRRIRRHVDAAVRVLLGEQIDGGGVGEEGLERVDCLFDEGFPVGEKQDAFGPVGAHQHVRQRDHRAGLARSGGHHQ